MLALESGVSPSCHLTSGLQCSLFLCEEIAFHQGNELRKKKKKTQIKHRSGIGKKHIKRPRDALPHYVLGSYFLDS